MNARMVGKISQGVLGMVVLFLTVSSAKCDLYLYDNFANQTVSNGLWTKSSFWDNSRVAWSTGYASLNMTANVSNKWAYMQMNQTVTLKDAADSVRVTWDMDIATASGAAPNGYFNGLSIGTSTTNLKAGQAGNSGGAFPWQTYIGASKSGTGALGQQWLHYDLTVTSTSQTLKVYVQNVAYNDDPTLYEGAVASWTKTISTVTLPTGTAMEIRFWVNDPYVVDSASSPRDTVYVDNVFTSVPEPASMTLVIAGIVTLVSTRKTLRAKR